MGAGDILTLFLIIIMCFGRGYYILLLSISSWEIIAPVGDIVIVEEVHELVTSVAELVNSLVN